MSIMWNRFRNSSSRTPSIASTMVVDAQSSQDANSSQTSINNTQPRISRVFTSSSKNSAKGQEYNELKDMQEVLDFHKCLVQTLGRNLQKYETELEKVRDVSAEQEKQVDIQQVEIERLYTAKTNQECQVAVLKKQVHEGRQRIKELLKAVNSMRKQDAHAKSTQNDSIPMDGIIKDALIEQLESDVERLTQEGLDHERETRALVSKHEQNVSALSEKIDGLRSDLELESRTATKNTYELGRMMKLKDTAEQELAQRIVREAVESKVKPNKVDAQSEHLKQAVNYIEELSTSQRLHEVGLEVELFHLSNMCTLAQSQEEEIARLSAANTQLQATNTQLKQEADSQASTLAKNSLETPDISRPISRGRTVTWDLPLRNEPSTTLDSAAIMSSPSKRSKLHKRKPISLRDLPPRTAGTVTPGTPVTPATPSMRSFSHRFRKSLSFSTAKDERVEGDKAGQLRAQLVAAREEVMKHQQEKEALREEVRGLKDQLSFSDKENKNRELNEQAMALLPSSSMESCQTFATKLDTGKVADRILASYERVRHEGARREGEEESKAYSYLFGDIPIRLGTVSVLDSE